MNWLHLLELAEQLARPPQTRGRPREALLRKAISIAYYAMFHALANSNANTLVGATYAITRSVEWTNAQRALNHGPARTQMGKSSEMARFHDDIQEFSDTFITMQAHRHEADYNPNPTHPFTRSEAFQHIQRAREVTEAFMQVPAPDRRAFAVHVLFGRRN